MIVLVGGEKGGTGKTTLAVNIAALRADSTGKPVMLVDTDVQESAASWAQDRREEGLNDIDCRALTDEDFIVWIKHAFDRYDDLIIDSDGSDSEVMRCAMRYADVMIIPFNASGFDVNTAFDMEQMLGELKDYRPKRLSIYAVINNLRNHPAMDEGTRAIEALKTYDNFTTLDSIIHSRVIFSRAAEKGRAVHEIKNGHGNPIDPKAKMEIEKLYQTIYEKQRR